MPSERGGLYADVPVGMLEGSPVSTDTLCSSPEWGLALRIASSKGLCKSEFLPRFLLYVCEQHLTGSTREMTEQHLGVHVFNRPPGYNPGEDNIVRSYARMLRKRLEEYFEGEGQHEPMRLTIARGAYVPSFYTPADPAPHTPVPIAEPSPAEHLRIVLPPPPETAPGTSAVAATLAINPGARRSGRLSSFSFLLANALLVTFAWFILRPAAGKKPQAPAHALWAQLFRSDRNTLIVPADSGLGILQNLTGHLVSLDEYTNGTYLSEIMPPAGLSVENLNDLRRQRYTSVVDLNIASTLTQLPEFNPTRSAIRYARSVSTEDLKSSNAILLGSTHTNPWVSLFEGKLNFVLQYTPEVNQSFVVNKQPASGEQATYKNGSGTAANKTYGLVDYLPSLDGVGHVLIIQGLNMAATQAAADILANAELMRPILLQASRPDGSLSSFELLVETSSIGASAPEPHIVGTRFYRLR